MRKTSFFVVFLLFAVSSFVIALTNRSIYIEGTVEQPAHMAFFMTNFGLEASALGFSVSDDKDQAGHTFNFQVRSHADEYDPSIRHIIFISLVNNETDIEIVSFGWPFAELEDMFEYNRFLFHTAAVHIPGLNEVVEVVELVEVVMEAPVDDSWKNKWLYLRASVDYPITFYMLQPTGLIGGQGAYAGPFDNPAFVQHLDHKIFPQPGITLGAELQFLDYLSFELNLQMHMGDPENLYFFNMATGAQLKYIKKTRNFMFQPYGAFQLPLNVSPEFSKFPSYAVGAGIQVGVRGGSSGAFFIDLNYMLFPGDVYMKNPYGDLAPNPSEIHYKRFTIGIGIGYKYGLYDR